MADSIHELNQDAFFEREEKDFREWTQDAEEMEIVFPSLKQVRTEMESAKGRIKFTARLADAYERYVDDKLYERLND